MKINAKEVLKLIDGKDIKLSEDSYLTVGAAIAEILLGDERGGKMKMFVLAQKFYSSDSVEVDEADLQLVKKAIEETKVYKSLIAGQLLLLLESKNEVQGDKKSN